MALRKFRTNQTDVTLDSFLYLPAYSLVNQHRLQSNLNQLEDQSLRRSSMLMLIVQLGRFARNNRGRSATLGAHGISVLISTLQNEYAIAHRVVNEKTLQEVDPFSRTNTDSSRDLVIDLELLALQDLVDYFLIPRIRRLFVKSDNRMTDLESSVTLSCLGLIRTIASISRGARLLNLE